MQYATAIDHETVGIDTGLYAQRQVLFQLFLQAVLQVTRRDELAVLAEEGRIVDHEHHAHGGFIDSDGRQGLRIVEIGNGIANFKTFDAHDGADVTALDLIHVGLAQAFEHHQLLDFALFDDIVPLAQAHRHAGLERTAGDAAHGDTAHVRGILQRGNQHLGRSFLDFRGRDFLQDGVQQSGDILRGLLPVLGHPALLGAAVNGLEVQLVLVGAQVEHEFENLLLHLVRAAVGFVHLINDHNGLLSHVDGLVEHETRLRHAALEGIHQQQHTVRHVEHALHFSTKVTVAGSVDNIDFHAFINHRNVLGENGDAAFAFQVVVVQDEVSKVFGLPHQVGLVNHAVHERGFAMVNMGDDGNVSDVLHSRFYKIRQIYNFSAKRTNA